MPTVETPYAEAKASKLYLPPIDEGAVLRDFYGGELHFPAGYVGSRPGPYVPLPEDGEKAWAYKRVSGGTQSGTPSTTIYPNQPEREIKPFSNTVIQKSRTCNTTSSQGQFFRGE